MLLRQYFNLMEAKVCNLSWHDFNQIAEILMAADLSCLPKDRLSFFIDVDHQPATSNSAGTRRGINPATLVLWLDVRVVMLSEGTPDAQPEGRLVEILHRISGADPAVITADARLMEDGRN